MGCKFHFMSMSRKCGVDSDWASNVSIVCVCVSDQLEAHLGEWKNKRVPVLAKWLCGRHRQARVRQLANGCVMIHLKTHTYCFECVPLVETVGSCEGFSGFCFLALSRFLFTTFFCFQIICAADKSESDRVVIPCRARFHSLYADLKSMTLFRGKKQCVWVCVFIHLSSRLSACARGLCGLHSNIPQILF